MRFTHFQVIFQQTGIYIPPVSLRGRRANSHLLVMFSAWTRQRLMKFSLPVGHNCKHLKSTSVRHLIALFEITTCSHHLATTQTRQWGSCSNMASDSAHSEPTNYEDSTPEWASDTFEYRSPNKNPFPRFAYPRVKKEFRIEELNTWSVEKLLKYLKNQGVVITTDTHNRDLVSKVYHACRVDLPLCSTKEQDDAQIKARQKEKLFIDGISLPLPEELENWVSGSHNFPNMTMNDIEPYLSKSNDRKSVKEGKNLYESGLVEFNNISDCLKFCYVRGKVVPQTRIWENPYTVWVCLNTTNGDILTGECGCMSWRV